MTVQRRTVAEVLSQPDTHLTADEVFKRARSLVPEISRATVYNALSELVSMGEVSEVPVAPGPARFDPNTNIRHHHFVCSDCGDIHDVHPKGVDCLDLSSQDKQRFRVQHVEVTFRGTCEDCDECESEVGAHETR